MESDLKIFIYLFQNDQRVCQLIFIKHGIISTLKIIIFNYYIRKSLLVKKEIKKSYIYIYIKYNAGS